MDRLHFVDACTQEHFRAMSLIHALGWRDTYVDAVPAEFMAREVTDDRWVKPFSEAYRLKTSHGLLLYRDDTPVACVTFGPARVENRSDGSICTFDSSGYRGWGEIMSFYTHPQERGKGYGGLLFDEACRRLKAEGFDQAFVLVLRENEGARRFYASHGFAWDGTHTEIPFPPHAVCIDLRYTAWLK